MKLKNYKTSKGKDVLIKPYHLQIGDYYIPLGSWVQTKDRQTRRLMSRRCIQIKEQDDGLYVTFAVKGDPQIYVDHFWGSERLVVTQPSNGKSLGGKKIIRLKKGISKWKKVN